MADTALREKILDKARELFNKSGYASVSMRDLAQALNIRVGNLTYYFPLKQDIVRALMLQNVEETVVHSDVITLKSVQDIFERMVDSLSRNLFFFLDSELYANEKLACNTPDRTKIASQLYEAVDKLIQQGVFDSAFSGTTQKEVLNILMLSHIFWIQQQIHPHQEPLYLTKTEFLQGHWHILFPYLTQKGREEYALHIAPLFSE